MGTARRSTLGTISDNNVLIFLKKKTLDNELLG